MVGGDQAGAAAHRLVRRVQAVVVELLVVADDDGIGRAFGDTSHAMLLQGLLDAHAGAHQGGRARLEERDRGLGRGHHLVGLGGDVDVGQLGQDGRHRSRRVVGEEQHPVAGITDLGHGLGRARYGIATKPQHAVEIEDPGHARV